MTDPIYNVETEYLDLLYCLHKEMDGEAREDRTKVGCYSRFGERFVCNLNQGFPLFTTKKVYWKGVVEELLWFLSANTNNNYLKEKNVHIWDEWELKNDHSTLNNKYSKGYLGPIYGKLWRDWDGVDQLTNIINEIKNNPNSRRLVISTWNPTLLPDPNISPQQNVLRGNQALACCHGSVIQFFVKNNKLSCQMYQRSADMFLGVPFNIASYSLFLMIVANICELEAGEFIHVLGDTHVYSNHKDQIKEQLKRTQLDFPEVKIKRKLSIEDLDVNNFNITMDDFELINYKSHSPIKAPVAV